MYWSMDDDLNKKENNTKLLPKSLIAIFIGYFLVMLIGVLFLVIPNQIRKYTLTEFGLDSDRSQNLIFLGFFTLKLLGELCQMFARTTILKREPSSLRILGFDRAPLKLIQLPEVGKNVIKWVIKQALRVLFVFN